MSDNLLNSNDLDALLAEIKGYSVPGTSPAQESVSAATPKDWSLDDIDALLADLDSPFEEKPAKEPKPEPEPEPEKEYVAKELAQFPHEDTPVDTFFRTDAKPAPVQIEKEPEPEPEPGEKAEEPALLYESEMSEDEINSLVFSLFGGFDPAAETAPEEKAQEEPSETQAQAPAISDAPVNTAEPQKEVEKEEDVFDNIFPPAPETAPPAPVNSTEAPAAEETEPDEEKPMGEIREFSRSKANARRLAGFVINEQTPEPEEEEEEDPDKIPDYDPLAQYMAMQKESEQAGMLTDENRESFINPMQLEHTAEIDNDFLEPFDKPGIIVKKSQYQMTSDLDPLPTVISADKAKEDAHTRIAGEKKAPVSEEPVNEEFPGQIKLSGFDPPPEMSPADNPQEEIEANLAENRRIKAKDFKLAASHLAALGDDEIGEIEFENLDEPENKDAPEQQSPQPRKKPSRGRRLYSLISSLPEYNEPADRRRVHSALNAASVISLRQVFVDALIELALIIFNVVPYFAENSSVFCRGGVGIYTANALLLIAAMVFNAKIMLSGFRSLVSGRPDARSAAAITAALAFIHTTVTAAVELSQNGEAPVFATLGVFAFAAVSLSDYFNAKRAIKNFELCAYKYEKKLYTVHGFDNETELRELSRNLMLEKADILYSSKTDFPANFLKNSENSAVETKAVTRILPIAGISAVITLIVSAIISRDAMVAVSAGCGSFCLAAPLFAALVPAVAVKSANSSLNRSGALLTGLDVAEDFSATNAVVIDSADIFNRKKCRMHGMVDFKEIRMDDLLVYAAALVIKSGGPLRECFESIISEDHNLLPTVRDLVYEEKLGISARIHSQKVLLGNRALLQNHSVNVPDKALEDKYTKTGKRVLYLAVCGKLAAMFVVSYAVDLKLRSTLEKLEDAGITIMVRTNDVNVTQDLLSRGFGIPKEAFCVLGSVAGRLFGNRRDEVSPFADIRMGHDGTAHSMLRAVTATLALLKNAEFGVFVQIALSVMSFAVCAILAATAKVPGAIASFLIASVLGTVAYFTSDFINRKD